jgi:hypothetical protein
MVDSSWLQLKVTVGLLIVLVLGVACGSTASKVSDAVSACSGLTLEQLKSQDSIDDTCRKSILSLLSSFNSNFQGKLYLTSGVINTITGRPELYLAGVKSTGEVYAASDFAAATIMVSLNSGTVTTLSSSDFTAAVASSTGSPQASVEFVLDYSASMREADLNTAAEISSMFVTYAPPIYEAEVIAFSKTVTQRSTYSTVSSSIVGALAKDTSITRASTALFDGVGKGVERLASRSTAAKVLFVFTDGVENASTTYTKSTAVSSLSSNKVFVVAVGSLFSDLSVLKELAGDRGVYLYGDELTTIKSNIGNFMKSFENWTQVTLPASMATAKSVTVGVGGVSAGISL